MRNSISILVSIVFICCSCGDTAKEEVKKVADYEYVHHIANDGDKPTEGSEVTYHREVYINNDSMLHSSFKTGAVTAILPARSLMTQGPPPPDYEAMFLMAPGDSMTMVQTLDSMPKLPPFLKKDDVLNYRIKLVSFRPAAEVEAEKIALQAREASVAESTTALIKEYTAGKLKSQIKTADSGLKYIVHEEGTGAQAAFGSTVDVQYSGFLTDGTPFDNSYKVGRAFSFPLGAGRVIKGWDEGISLLKEGAKVTFFIPAELGYGKAGSPPVIPADSELVFYVELEKVK